jgi:hypothetical protein
MRHEIKMGSGLIRNTQKQVQNGNPDGQRRGTRPNRLPRGPSDMVGTEDATFQIIGVFVIGFVTRSRRACHPLSSSPCLRLTSAEAKAVGAQGADQRLRARICLETSVPAKKDVARSAALPFPVRLN